MVRWSLFCCPCVVLVGLTCFLVVVVGAWRIVCLEEGKKNPFLGALRRRGRKKMKREDVKNGKMVRWEGRCAAGLSDSFKAVWHEVVWERNCADEPAHIDICIPTCGNNNHIPTSWGKGYDNLIACIPM